MENVNNGHGRGRGRMSGQEMRRPHDLTSSPQAQMEPRPAMPNTFASVVRNNASAGGDHRPFSTPATPPMEPGRTSLGTPRSANVPSFVLESKLSPFAREFVPRDPPKTEDEDMFETSPITPVLNDFIYDVTLRPGNFDSNVPTFLQTLCNMISTAGAPGINTVIGIIFNHAIREPNFSYNAARLCNYLNDSCPTFPNVNFISVLIERCLLEYGKRETIASSELAKLRGLTVFLADLYSRIKDPKMAAVAESLPCLFDTLLNHPTPENLKCICQMMKFTGASLEDEEKKAKNNETPTMDKLVERLESSIAAAPRDLQSMMTNVVRLRAANWGRETSSPSPPPSNHNESLPSDISTDTVYYGPDGQPITVEEARFLENAQNYGSAYVDGDQFGDDEESDEMDDEIAAAYEEFLATTGQRH